MPHYSVIKKKESSIKSQKDIINLKRILLNERSQFEKVTCTIPMIRYSGKGKTVETVKRSVVFRCSRGGREQ